MAITGKTALAMFHNPKKLRFQLYREGGKQGFTVEYGPRRNFNIILRAQSIFETDEAALRAITELIEKICAGITSQPDPPSSLMLLGEYRQWVILQLRRKRSASTCDYEAEGKVSSEQVSS